jgi:hypothetical protein
MDRTQTEIKESRGGEKEKKWTEWRQLKKELREREDKAVRDVLGQTQVVLATCTGADHRFFFFPPAL